MRVAAADIREADAQTAFTLHYPGGQVGATIPCIGLHNVRNAVAACGVGMALGIPAEKCAAALAAYVPSGMRQRVVHWGSVTVVEDCYNASPDSMRAALTTLSAMRCAGRRIAVLGGMLELGAYSQAAHREVGRPPPGRASICCLHMEATPAIIVRARRKAASSPKPSATSGFARAAARRARTRRYRLGKGQPGNAYGGSPPRTYKGERIDE